MKVYRASVEYSARNEHGEYVFGLFGGMDLGLYKTEESAKRAAEAFANVPLEWDGLQAEINPGTRDAKCCAVTVLEVKD